MIRKFKNYILLNLLITLILSSFIYFLFVYYSEKQIQERLDQSINIHVDQLDTFINDTMSAVESVSTIVTYEKDDDVLNDKISDIKKRDPRILNIYVLDTNSIVLNSNNDAMINTKLKPLSFFNKNTNLNNITISEVDTNAYNKQVIYISKFIPDTKSKTLITAEIDMSAIGSIIDTIQKNSTITIKDFEDHIIFQSFRPVESHLTASAKFQKAPWEMVISSNENVYYSSLDKLLLSFLVIGLLIATIQLFIFNNREQKKKQMIIDDINSQKKEMVGMLAANTAHEIKNPLTSIKGFVDLLQMKYDPNRDNPHFLIVKEELDRINVIVSQFLLLGKPTKVDLEITDLRDVVRSVLTFMRYDLERNNLMLKTSFTEHQLVVNITTDQFKQVIINLLQNAKDAIPESRHGVIEIKVNYKDEEAYVSIRDNGVGMSKQMIEHLFDPFYTTKANGTGLGLPVSKSIIDANNGRIHVTSNEGVGTTFIVYVPLISLKSEYDQKVNQP